MITALFFRILGYLASCLGASEAARKLEFKSLKLMNQVESLCCGLCIFGNRFLVSCDNHAKIIPVDLKAYREKGYCRGACYWLMEKYFSLPSNSLIRLAKELEQGIPHEVARLHDSQTLPPKLTEERLWAYRLTHEWKELPVPLPEEVLSFRIGLWKSENEAIVSHRIAVFKRENAFIFDPAFGLAIFRDRDWIPYLRRAAAGLGSFQANHFYTIECFRHSLNTEALRA